MNTAGQAPIDKRAENGLVKAQGTTLSDTQIAKLNEQLILARAEIPDRSIGFVRHGLA
jgi:hypothetical protein